ncbi:ubiquitin-like domain-containing protein [Thermocatellispora tengchongensis]|uniref:ubiquitin-like domain-containing protein n=1 Tax=Thermocatellispora tengchongensis TaxID=1073253 RepID=UPI003637C0BC
MSQTLRRRRRGRRRRPPAAGAIRDRLGWVAGGVIAVVAVIAVTVVSAAAEVELIVDGELRRMRGFATTVDEALTSAGVKVGAGDYLHPAAETRIGDGSRIVVRHARPIRLTLDGERSTQWVTANNVGEALDELGLRDRAGALSAPTTQMLPLAGMDLTVRTRRSVVVMRDKVRMRATTTGATVRDVLSEQEITLRDGERVRPGLNRFPEEGRSSRSSRPLPG